MRLYASIPQLHHVGIRQHEHLHLGNRPTTNMRFSHDFYSQFNGMSKNAHQAGHHMFTRVYLIVKDNDLMHRFKVKLPKTELFWLVFIHKTHALKPTLCIACLYKT